MKLLFTKVEKEVYLPGDPGRGAFEEQWRLAGGNPEEMAGQTIEVHNDMKVTTFKFCENISFDFVIVIKYILECSVFP